MREIGERTSKAILVIQLTRKLNLVIIIINILGAARPNWQQETRERTERMEKNCPLCISPSSMKFTFSPFFGFYQSPYFEHSYFPFMILILFPYKKLLLVICSETAKGSVINDVTHMFLLVFTS